jgi:ABC-type transport system substrate-binding protein
MRTACAILLLLTLGLCPACSQGDGGAGGDAAVKAFMASHPRITDTTAGDDASDQSITVATADKVATLDPQNTENGGDIKVVNQIYQTLVRIDPDKPDVLNPELAASWTVADDGLSIAFAVRPGVVFHDGSPLDAKAVKLSIDRLHGTYHHVPAAPYRGFYDFIQATEAGGLTFTVRLNRPVARVALRNLSMFPASIISPRLLEVTEKMSPGEASTFISEWASGTGPFYLSKLDTAAARVRLNAFDRYWGGKPVIHRVIFRQVADPNSQIEYLKSGEADMLDDVPRPVWDRLDAEPNVTLHKWWALNLCYLGLNVLHEKASDIRVRQAIRLAIDRQPLLELYYGSARPAYSLIPQPFAEYDPDYRAPETDQPVEDCRALAKGMLERAGAVGRQMTIYFPAHPRPYLPTPDKVADKIRQQLNDIGLIVRIVAVENAELFDSIKNNRYELVLMGWMSDNADADNFYVPLAGGDPKTKTPAPTNIGRAFEPEAYDLMLKAQGITDQAQRVAAYRKIERMLQERTVAYVPLTNPQQGMAWSNRLEGVEVDPLGYYRFYKSKVAPRVGQVRPADP